MEVSGTGMTATDPDWYRNREYWSENRRFIWSDRLIGASVEAAARIVSLLALEPGASVLDLACGFGRHSLELAAKGCRVTGVDLNPDLIGEAVARLKGVTVEALARATTANALAFFRLGMAETPR